MVFKWSIMVNAPLQFLQCYMHWRTISFFTVVTFSNDLFLITFLNIDFWRGVDNEHTVIRGQKKWNHSNNMGTRLNFFRHLSRFNWNQKYLDIIRFYVTKTAFDWDMAIAIGFFESYHSLLVSIGTNKTWHVQITIFDKLCNKISLLILHEYIF